jgi:ABC-type transport system substrate-binding protein
MPNVSWVYVILGGQWATKPTYDPKVPWALPDAEKAKKVRLALNYAVDKQAIMQRVLGGLGTVVNSWLSYPADPWATDALKKPLPFDPAKAKQLLAEAGYPNGFETTMNLTAWPGRGYLPDVGEAVATYWEKIGIKVKRRPLDRAVFASDFRARKYSGVALAYAAPLVAPEAWEVLIRGSHTKAALNLFVEHPKLDEYLDRLSVMPSYQERVRVMRDEMLPWLAEYVPGIAIGAAHAIGGVGPKVGDWPIIPGHMGFHNWEYVTRK